MSLQKYFQRFWAIAGAVSVRTKILGIVLALVILLGAGVIIQSRYALTATMSAQLEGHPRLKIIFFPTASPDLNPQEHAWKVVRTHIGHNDLETRLPELADRFLIQLNSATFKSSFLDKYGFTAICPMFI